jgi:hypothetical protein
MKATLEDIHKDYCDYGYKALGYKLNLNFSIEEVFEFLEKKGYMFIKHKALVDITVYDHFNDSKATVVDCARERVAVVREGDALPERWDNEQGKKVSFFTVFEKEIKSILLR